jgi:hypothetical protein
MEEAVVTAVPGSAAERSVRLTWQTPELTERELVDVTQEGGGPPDPDFYGSN